MRARRSRCAPDLAQAHLALAYVSENTLDFTQAGEAYERALRSRRAMLRSRE